MEEEKKLKKKGDKVSFRLPIKMKYSEEVINFINDALVRKELNQEIIVALEFYVKYKKYANLESIVEMFEKKSNKKTKTKLDKQPEPVDAPEVSIGDDIFAEKEIVVAKVEVDSSVEESTKINEIKKDNGKVIELDLNKQHEVAKFEEDDAAADELFSEKPKVSGLARAFSTIKR